MAEEPGLSSAALHILSELRHCGQLCDAVLHTEEGGQFEVHRAIMSACSPYFSALFSNSSSVKASNHFSIPGVSSNMMGLIIDYAYTRDFCVSWDNIQDVLPAADQLNIMGMVNLCCAFLAAEIAPENCIGIHRFAQVYHCPELEKLAYKFIMSNFPEVSQRSEELPRLPLQEVAALLSSDDLNAASEELVWEAACRWIDAEPEVRRADVAALLGCVRLGLLDPGFFLRHVEPHRHVAASPACRPLVLATLQFYADLETLADSQEEVETPQMARPRLPHEILFAVGGWSGGSPTNYIETYDSRAERWVRVPDVDPAGPRAYHKCAVLGHDIYVIGGFDGVVYFNGCRCFNAVSKKWREVAPMHSRRCYVSVTVLNGRVYAMGGFDGVHRQNTAERYDHEANQWSYIAPMNMQRSDASSATLSGSIYITGGFNGNECLSTAECYNVKAHKQRPSGLKVIHRGYFFRKVVLLQANQWTMIAPMLSRRSGVSCAALHGSLYVLGGFNGMSRLASGERYNPRTNSWAPIPEMASRRSNFAMEKSLGHEVFVSIKARADSTTIYPTDRGSVWRQVVDDLVFAIGGYNGDTIVCQVECYDDRLEQWLDATDMSVFRSALAACVLRGLPNRQDFVYKHRDRLLEEKRLRNLQFLQLQASFQNP
ncbi:KLHL10 [Cordylochernes scorpioides]|uniref:Kelch-like protein diablo n=1 Tax=Cordylochernes scorpioides TaxID=51811 RepID=A0ABY6L5A4_9ARAC|nr:KLHL10 [Cordylochernes scorpioides]